MIASLTLEARTATGVIVLMYWSYRVSPAEKGRWNVLDSAGATVSPPSSVTFRWPRRPLATPPQRTSVTLLRSPRPSLLRRQNWRVSFLPFSERAVLSCGTRPVPVCTTAPVCLCVSRLLPPPHPPPHTHTHRACSVCAWLSRSGVSHLSSPSVEQEGRWRWEGEGSTGVHLGFGCWLAPQASSMVYLVLLGAGIRSMSRALQSWESYRQEQIPPVSSCGWVDINMTMKRTIMHSKEKGNKQPNKQARLASLGKQTNRQRLKVQEQDFLTNQGGASACRVSSSMCEDAF